MGSFSGHETRLVVSLCRPVETRGDWELGALCRSYVISFNPNKGSNFTRNFTTTPKKAGSYLWFIPSTKHTANKLSGIHTRNYC